MDKFIVIRFSTTLLLPTLCLVLAKQQKVNLYIFHAGKGKAIFFCGYICPTVIIWEGTPLIPDYVI